MFSDAKRNYSVRQSLLKEIKVRLVLQVKGLDPLRLSDGNMIDDVSQANGKFFTET